MDDSGARHQGKVVVAHDWRPELMEEVGAGDEFRIVLLVRAPRPAIPSSPPPHIALCLPEKVPARSRFLREAPSSYFTDPLSAPDWEAPSGLPILDPQTMKAFAQGSILMAGSTAIAPGDVFPPEAQFPRLHLLAQRLLGTPMGEPLAGVYWQAVAAALAAPSESPVSDPAAILASLRQVVDAARLALAPLEGPAAELLGDGLGPLFALAQVGSPAHFLELAQHYYPSPAALAEGILMCRALASDARAAAEVARMRRYLLRAEVPPSQKDLAWQRTLALEQTSFAILVTEAHRLPSIRATFEYFHHRYRAVYQEHHRSYHAKVCALRENLDLSRQRAEALARLNGIPELGPPLGQDALEAYERLLAGTFVCPDEARLTEALVEDPLCPTCNITLASQPTEGRVSQVLRRLERALGQQLRRLSSEAVRRILAESQEGRVEQFLQAVVASDTASLVNVLDDEMADFLRRLLAPRPAAVPLRPVLERLQQAFPQVEQADVEAVVEELRRLLREAVQ